MPQLTMEQVRLHNEGYRAGNPDISDEHYDALLEEIQSKLSEKEYFIFRTSLREPGGDVKLTRIAGSLKKCTYGTNQLEKFLSKKELHDWKLFISAKLDGMGYIATYINGTLVSVTTTGDGISAEDITTNARVFLPNLLPVQGILEIRGELVLEKDAAVVMGYKNARNGVVGLMKKFKNPNYDHLANVRCPAYQIMNDTEHTYEEQYAILENFGFEVPFHKTDSLEYGQNLNGFEEDLKDLLEDWKSGPYLIDGLVINDSSELPENALLPKNTIAYKVNADVVKTTVIGLDIETSKDGNLCGVALLEPVEINGTTVKRASIYNFKNCLDKKIGPGAEVIITKAGEIIPKILEVVKPGRLSYEAYWELCPTCGTKTKVDGVNLQCPNPDCEAKSMGSLNSFIRRCDIKGASEVSLTKWGIESFKDLLNFVPSGKSAEKFYADFEAKVFNKTAEEILKKFNWTGVGEKTLTKYIESLGFETFIDAIKIDAAVNHPSGTGEKTWSKIVAAAEDNLAKLSLFTNDPRFNPIEEEIVETSTDSIFNSLSFCCTGTLTRKRKEIEADIIANGGSIKSVSKNLDYLVAGEKAGSKLAKAEKFGIKIITEAELNEMLKG